MLCISAVAGGSVFLAPAAAAQSQPPDQPSEAKLSVIGARSARLSLQEPRGEEQSAIMRVLIANSGAKDTSLRFGAYLGNGTRGRQCIADVVPAHAHAPLTAPAHKIVDAQVELTLPSGCAGSTGVLVVRGYPGVDPVATEFTLARRIPTAHLWWAAFGGFVAAGLVTTILAVVLIRRSTPWWKWITQPIAAGPSWSFKDSWLTNVAGVGAILGTVLGAADLLDDLFPGTSTAPAVGLSVLAGALVAVAPVAYYALTRWAPGEDDQHNPIVVAEGTGGALTFATAVTLSGTYCGLATIGMLAWEADIAWRTTIALLVLVGIGAAVVAIYAVRWTAGVAEQATAANKPVRTGGAAL
jgi:hypothetical protein